MKKQKLVKSSINDEKFRAILGRLTAQAFYEMQEMRISQTNMIRDIIRRKDLGIGFSEVEKKQEEKTYDKDYADALLKDRIKAMFKQGKFTEAEATYVTTLLENIRKIGEQEKSYGKLLAEYVKDEPIYTEFLQHIRGVSFVLTANLLRYFGYCDGRKETGDELCPTISSLWKYCVPSGIPILTENGWKKIEDIDDQDSVLSHNGLFNKVKKKFVRDFEGDLVTIKSAFTLPIRLTPEHPIAMANIRRIHRTSGYEYKRIISWKMANQLKVGDYLIIPKLKHSNTDKEIKIKFASDKAESKMKMKSIKLKKETFNFFGRFLGDGSATKYKEGKYDRGYTFLCFGVSEKDEIPRYLKVMKSQFGREPKLVRSGNEFILDFGRLSMANTFIELFGTGKKERKIPSQIFGANKEMVKSFLEGYFSADGCKVIDKHGKHYEIGVTHTEGLALQTQMLGTKIGKLINLCKMNSKSNFRGKEIISQRYNLGLRHSEYQYKQFQEDQDYFYVKIKKISKERYKGKVFNMEVANTNTYLVSNVVVHNCGLAPDQKRTKGEKANYNPKAKVLAWKIADSFLKQRTPIYRDIYDAEKIRQEEILSQVDGEKAVKMHSHLRAMRKMVKMFLAHYWLCARELKGLPVTKPYIIGKGNHSHFVGWKEVVEANKIRAKTKVVKAVKTSKKKKKK